MKVLAIFAYLCGVFAILGFGLLAWDEIRWKRFWSDDDSFKLLLLIAPALQITYVRRMIAVLHLPSFKQTRTLDELAIHDGDMDVEVVGTNAFWQGVVIINSIMLCILVLAMTSALPYFLFDEFNRPMNAERVSLILILIAYLCAVPTIIFNLRTFQVRRVRTRTDSFE
jgi:hypothetical protein